MGYPTLIATSPGRAPPPRGRRQGWSAATQPRQRGPGASETLPKLPGNAEPRGTQPASQPALLRGGQVQTPVLLVPLPRQQEPAWTQHPRPRPHTPAQHLWCSVASWPRLERSPALSGTGASSRASPGTEPEMGQLQERWGPVPREPLTTSLPPTPKTRQGQVRVPLGPLG